MTEELIRKVNLNHIILATGANPIMPKILGINLPSVVQANDILSGKELMKHLNESRVKFMVNTKVVEIKANSVVIEGEGKIEEIGAEQVVIAIGSKSENIL
ncbi:hypothetical protein AB2T96_07735 [Clostridium butyricum]|uniref:hypothetical protein n=1 Tax=Clostridium butyricum TaxID=1492 RepID=UPI001CA9A7D2|nr:hypothetical protein [Clostridium butyricum]MBZ0312658.1 hypothetical protein [Clostridium butyricum]MDU4853140.1 hypothetical protein [Clostridioides difficile]